MIGGIFLPRRWNRQPTQRVGINWRHPLAASLNFAFTPTQGMNDVARGFKSQAVSVGTTIGTSSRGLVIIPANESTAGVDYGVVGANAPWGTTNRTMLLIAAPSISSKIKIPFGWETEANAISSNVVLFNCVPGSSASAGTWGVQEYYNAMGFCYNAGNTMTGKMSTYSASCTSAPGGACYVDGVAVTTTTGGTQRAIPDHTGEELAVGHPGANHSATYSMDDPVLLVYAWNRVLTADEHAELARAPWQLFSPRKARTVYSIIPASRRVLWVTQ